MRLSRCAPVLLLGVALLAGCDSPSGTEDPTSRTVSFDYRGPTSGSFQVQGPPAAGGPHQGPFVGGSRQPYDVSVVINAFRPTEGTLGDRITLLFPGQTGTHSCTCPEGSTDDCAEIVGRFNTDRTGSVWRQGDERFFIDSCTVTVEELTAERARGTFTGVGIVYWKVVGDSIMEAPLTITNGRFNVELHPE